MRRGLAATLLVLAAMVPPAEAAHSRGHHRHWRPHVGAARAFANHRYGVVSFAVRRPGKLWGDHVRLGAPSASVVKAMLLVAYLRQPALRRRRLRYSDRRLLAPMVRWSSNGAASSVFGIVGPGGLERLARRARMRRFHAAAPIWGNSRIDAADQTRFFLHIDRLIPRRHRRYALRLLNTIVRSQRWGIGRVRPHGWTLYFKGGWGSGTGAIDHQVALLRHGRRRLAVAVLTRNSPSHAYGKATLRGVFRRLLRGLSRRKQRYLIAPVAVSESTSAPSASR